MFYLQPSFASDGITTIKCQGCFPKLQDQDEWLEVDEFGRNLSPFLLKALGPLSLSLPLMFVGLMTYVYLVFPMIQYKSKPIEDIFTSTNHTKACILLLSPYNFTLSFLLSGPQTYGSLSINSIGYILNLV